MAIEEHEDANEKQCLVSGVQSVCALFTSNHGCTLNHCRIAIRMLESQYNINNLNIDEALLEMSTRGNGKKTWRTWYFQMQKKWQKLLLHLKRLNLGSLIMSRHYVVGFS